MKTPHIVCGLPLMILLGASFALSGFADESHAAHWAYSGTGSPADWGTLDPAYSACSHGHMQSPIDITQAQPAELPALQLHYVPTPLNIIDNGHTVQVNLKAGSTLTVGDRVYQLKQFHFHHPSEEHLNGREFPLEAHLVHQDAAGHLAVIAVLFEEGQASQFIDALWHNIPPVKGKPLEVPAVSVHLLDMLPSQHGYFTYAGSLTTPPCTEGVTWYVLKQPASVSTQQIATFATLYPSDARPIQPTGERKVLESQ